MNSTLNYYNLNAEKYVENTINVDVSENRNIFVSRLNKNDKILDVGCGSGRDSLFFINNGFNVTAIEPSIKLAKLATQKINQNVIVKKIEDLTLENEFDAIWAMASLLHLKKDDLPKAISNCIKSLKQEKECLFFSAFKIGNGESYDQNGRFFSYYQPEEIKSILENTGLFSNIAIVINKDNLGRDNEWINVFATKPKLQLKKETKRIVSF